MRIALVEDDKAQREILRSFCSRYAKEKHTEITLDEFEQPLLFLDRYDGRYDLVFMDILMPYMDGMACAAALREKDEQVALCFVTSMAQYAIHGYEVGAVDFIVKPVKYEEFAMKMARIERILQKRESPMLLINGRQGVHRIDMRDLYYVEVYNHSLLFHTRDGNIETYGKLSALEEDPKFSGFIRTTPAYLVNIRHIGRIDENTLTVHGERVPISRRRRKECLEQIAGVVGGVLY